MKNSFDCILPKPKKVLFKKGPGFSKTGKLTCNVPESVDISSFFDENTKLFKKVTGNGKADVTARIDRTILSGQADDPALLDEGYVLDVSGNGIALSARTARGMYYGFQTLLQLVRTGKKTPALRIEDWPDMKYRGVHLMLGSLMPSFERMKRIVEIMASHKINSFVIEYDHCFKWEKYPFIAHPDAYTKEQTIELENFAAARFMEIVPCIDSLGHQDSYLCHKQLAHLREDPDSADSLCPSNPDSLDFIKDLWQELLDAHPRSKRAHVTGDEAFRRNVFCRKCKAEICKNGVGGLVVDYYTKLARWLMEQGREPVMWNDMIVKFADRISAVSNDIMMCDWMYENTDTDKWSSEDIYWNNMESATPGVWEKEFGEYWKQDKHGYIKPFPYLRYFHDKGYPVVGAPAAGTGKGRSLYAPYQPLEKKHANIMRFADTIKETGARGILNTFWASVPFDSAWHTVLIGADYGWNARIETPSDFANRFGSSFLGLEKQGAELLDGLDRALFMAPSHETYILEKSWHEKSAKPILEICEKLQKKKGNNDTLPYRKILTLCAQAANAMSGLGKVFNTIDTARIGVGKDTPVDISAKVSHSFASATPEGTFSVPFKSGKHKINGVPFNIIDPAKNNSKSVITMKGRKIPDAPDRTAGIRVNRAADRVFILASGFDAYDNISIADMTLRMENGNKHCFQIIGGRNILDWSGGTNKSIPSGLPVTECRKRRGCMFWFDNPEPGIKIESIEFTSKGTHGSLTIAGITTRLFAGKQPSINSKAVLKEIDKGEKEMNAMLEKLSSKVYPEIMPLSDAKSGVVLNQGTLLSAWLKVYRDAVGILQE